MSTSVGKTAYSSAVLVHATGRRQMIYTYFACQERGLNTCGIWRREHYLHYHRLGRTLVIQGLRLYWKIYCNFAVVWKPKLMSSLYGGDWDWLEMVPGLCEVMREGSCCFYDEPFLCVIANGEGRGCVVWMIDLGISCLVFNYWKVK